MTHEISDETKNAFQWLLSETWETFILASLGEYDNIEEKLARVLLFATSSGITECSMALEEDLDKEALQALINNFKDQVSKAK